MKYLLGLFCVVFLLTSCGEEKEEITEEATNVVVEENLDNTMGGDAPEANMENSLDQTGENTDGIEANGDEKTADINEVEEKTREDVVPALKTGVEEKMPEKEPSIPAEVKKNTEVDSEIDEELNAILDTVLGDELEEDGGLLDILNEGENQLKDAEETIRGISTGE